MKPVVYIDILFLLNFFVNTVTIYISFILTRQDVKFRRLAASAGFLSLYSCIIFFPEIGFMYTLTGKTIALTLACLIAQPTKSWLKLIKNIAVLFLSTAILGGIAFTLIFATDFGTTVGSAVSNGEFYINIKASTLTISILLSYACVYIISEIKKSAQIHHCHMSDITITFEENKVSLKGFFDTGCHLCEPISKSPAIIINKNIAKKLIPEMLFDACVDVSCKIVPDKYLTKYRIIPYSTIDSHKGYLSGIFPDFVSIDGKTVDKCIIAVSKENLNPDGNYDAIFGTEIFYENNLSERTPIL